MFTGETSGVEYVDPALQEGGEGREEKCPGEECPGGEEPSELAELGEEGKNVVLWIQVIVTVMVLVNELK